MGVGWMESMYTYARWGGTADLTVTWPESNGSGRWVTVRGRSAKDNIIGTRVPNLRQGRQV